MNNKALKITVGVIVLLAVLIGGMALSNQGRNVPVNSQGLDKNGMFKGVKAKDYVELCDYKNIKLATSAVEPTAEELEEQVQAALESNAQPVQRMDKVIEAGDRVSIDYVGSIDGVEFEGGNSQSSGPVYTAGSSELIDDFLDQIIGHVPGDTLDVVVTFPENYGSDTLNGKEAVFKTTINYVEESEIPALTDAWVAETYAERELKTVSEFKDALKEEMRKANLTDEITAYLVSNCKVKEIPQAISDYEEASMRKYYQDYGSLYQSYYGISYEDFLKSYGFESEDALVEAMRSDLDYSSTLSLIYQAIAEDANLKVGKSDVKEFYNTYYGSEDYSAAEQSNGLPYLMFLTLNEKVQQMLEEGVIYQ